MRGRLAVAAALAALLAVPACGNELPEEEPVVVPADALTLTGDVDPGLAGVSMAVGSQEGAVDEVLGWIAVEVLQAAGMEVTDDLALGDSRATREAQLAGLIDVTWETTGTGWLTLLREIGPSRDPEQLYLDVRDEDLDENGIVWLPPAPADGGVGVVANPEVVEELDIRTLSELATGLSEGDEGVAVCVSSARRPLDPAGMAALADAAGVRLRANRIEVVPDVRLVRRAEVGRACPFALVERLDPRLVDADLTFLEDDVGAFVAENPAVTIRADTEDLAPGFDDLFEPVSAALDTEALRELAGAAADGDPRDAARQWLVDQDLAEAP